MTRDPSIPTPTPDPDDQRERQAIRRAEARRSPSRAEQIARELAERQS